MRNKRYVLLVCGFLAAILGACLLFLFNPETTSYYPRCPFYVLTGLQCPGCGTLRGLHALMHLHLADAWRFNPAMIVSVPYNWVVSFIPQILQECVCWQSRPRIDIGLVDYSKFLK